MRPSAVPSNRPNNDRSFLPTKSNSSTILGLRNQSQASKLTSRLPSFRRDSKINQPGLILGARKVTEKNGKFLRPKNGNLSSKIEPVMRIARNLPKTERKEENEENNSNAGEEFKSDPSSLRNILANRSIKNSQQPEVKPPYRLSMYQTRNVLSENMFNLKDQNPNFLAPPFMNKMAAASPKINPFSGCSTSVRESIYYSKSPSCKLKFSTNTTSYKPMSTTEKFAASRYVPSTSSIFLPNQTNSGLISKVEMRTSMYSRPGLKLNAIFQAPNTIPEIRLENEETVKIEKYEKREHKDISSTNMSAPIENSTVNEPDLRAARNFFSLKSNMSVLDGYLQSLNFDDLQKELLFINGVEMLIKKNLLTKTMANSSTTSHLRITPTNKQGTLTKIDEIDSEEKSDNCSIKDTISETFTRIQEKKATGKGNCENSSTITGDSLQVSKPHTPVDAQSLTAKTPKTLLKSAARSSSPIKALTDESLLLVAAAAVAKNHSNPKLLIDFGPEMSLDRSPILSQNEDEKNLVDQLFVCSTNDLEKLSVTFFNAIDLNGENDCHSVDNETNSTQNSIKIENLVDLR